MDAIRASAAITTFAIVAVLSAGCQAVTSAAEPVELTLAHIDGGPELDPAVDWYAERVAELSGGELTIDVSRSCCGDEADVEERLVDRVASGEADLGWVGTRALTELGIAELSALTAPMLLDDYPVQRAALESDAAVEALVAVDELGVEGIALVPGAVRHPLASGSALVAAADWAGVTVASFRSVQQAEAFTALGAEPLDVSFEERDTGLFNGSIRAIENSLPFLDLSREQIVPFATVNVGLWPRVSAVIGNPSSMERLGDDQAGILRQAGADVTAMTSDLRALDEQAIASACASGAVMVEAPDNALEGLRAAFTPVIERLRNDERAAPLLAAIEDLRAESGPASRFDLPQACGEPTASAEDQQATGDPAVLNGAYRSPELTIESLTAEGLSSDDAPNAAGVFTFTFLDGRFELSHDAATGGIFGCDGSYTVAGDRVDVDYLPGGDCGPGGDFFDAAFTVDAAQLVLTDLRAGLESDEVLFERSWSRVE